VSVIDILEKYNVKAEYTLGLIDGSKEPDLAMGFIGLVKSPGGQGSPRETLP
jgi:hypothetical protein